MTENIGTVKVQKKTKASEEKALMEFYNFVCDLHEKIDQKRAETVKAMWDSSGEPYPPDVRKELEEHGLLGN